MPMFHVLAHPFDVSAAMTFPQNDKTTLLDQLARYP